MSPYNRCAAAIAGSRVTPLLLCRWCLDWRATSHRRNHWHRVVPIGRLAACVHVHKVGDEPAQVALREMHQQPRAMLLAPRIAALG